MVVDDEDPSPSPSDDEKPDPAQKKGLLQDVVLEKFPAEANCLHECIRPADYVAPDIPVRPPAREYPFNLDTFQRKAVECLEKHQTVLVAAHTSAGKTAVAEYAISMALRDKQRLVYTSPIKALSNQKYRDMTDDFQDVGLMTGDVTINQLASVMIMTTEILRSMLYKGSELCREMKWVVFDEVHYMRDKERGVIWEETIILLPEHVNMVFLSATIPNAREFAEWVCRIKRQPCNVIYTDYRPVPLQHYLFPAMGEGVFLAVNEKGEFLEDNFQRAVGSISRGLDKALVDGKKNSNDQSALADLAKVLQMCSDKSYLPVIVFSFSRKTTETNASAMKKQDLTTDDEKTLIEEIFNNAIMTLSDEDRQLP